MHPPGFQPYQQQQQFAPPKSSSSAWIWGCGIGCVVLVLLGGVGGAGYYMYAMRAEEIVTPPVSTPSPTPVPTPVPPPTPTGRSFVSTDGLCTVTGSERWYTMELNNSASLELSTGDMYLIVISEARGNSSDLAGYSALTRGFLRNAATSFVESTPTPTTVGGSPAIETRIDATVDATNVTYIHTVIQTPANFHQMLVWTLQTDFAMREAELRAVIQSSRFQ